MAQIEWLVIGVAIFDLGLLVWRGYSVEWTGFGERRDADGKYLNYSWQLDNSACQLRMTSSCGDAASPARTTARKTLPVWRDIVGICARDYTIAGSLEFGTPQHLFTIPVALAASGTDITLQSAAI